MTHISLGPAKMGPGLCDDCTEHPRLPDDPDKLCLVCRTNDPFTCNGCGWETVHQNDLLRIQVVGADGSEEFLDLCVGCIPPGKEHDEASTG